MIKKFENFNKEKEVTLEMCDELVFYTSAGIYRINDDEYKLFEFDDLLFYNAEYKEMKAAAKKLFNLSKNNELVKEAVISLLEEGSKRYKNLIRFGDLEDLFIEEIDNDFSFNLLNEYRKLIVKITKNQDGQNYDGFSNWSSGIIKQNTQRGLKLSTSNFYNLEDGNSIWSVYFSIKL
jgi:hypothetical protein